MVDLQGLSIDEQKKALVWQCRRGIKEIEVILIPFLEEHFEKEDYSIRQAFIALLEEADLDIFEWFMHREKPESEQMELIINVILERLQTRSE
jgi:antitoxin CptB